MESQALKIPVGIDILTEQSPLLHPLRAFAEMVLTFRKFRNSPMLRRITDDIARCSQLMVLGKSSNKWADSGDSFVKPKEI